MRSYLANVVRVLGCPYKATGFFEASTCTCASIDTAKKADCGSRTDEGRRSAGAATSELPSQHAENNGDKHNKEARVRDASIHNKQRGGVHYDKYLCRSIILKYILHFVTSS